MFILFEKSVLRVKAPNMPYPEYSGIQYLFSINDGVERRILYLKDEKYDFFKQYPNLDHYYVVTDMLIDKAFGVYTDGLEKLIKYGTIL